MKPTVEGPGYQLYFGKAEQILPFTEPVDLLLADPPYGIGESNKKNSTRPVLAKARNYGDYDWDVEPLELWIIEMARTKATWQIIFGGNYYALPPAPCWLIWDKQNGANDFADCELAWTNLPKATRIIHHLWHGMIRKGNEARVHPTQKPLEVMRWALNQAPAEVETVLDFVMGSGTTGVACMELGRTFIGIERDERYFEIAAKRIEAAAAQGRLFETDAPQVAPEPLALFA